MINASNNQLKLFFALCMELSFMIIKKEEYEDVKQNFYNTSHSVLYR